MKKQQENFHTSLGLPAHLSHTKRLKYLAFTFLALFLCSAGIAYALEEGLYSESEKAGFAFYKLANHDPDFRKWIMHSDRYIAAKPIDKVEMLQKDVYRLQAGFLNFSPDIDLITLDLPATIKAAPTAELDGEKHTLVHINFADVPDKYFPFQVGEMWIAVVLKDFDVLTNMSLTQREYDDFARKVKFEHGNYTNTQHIKVQFKLRPISVDATAPVEVMGIEMWPMLAEIGSMELWQNYFSNKLILWSYNAPWYLSESQSELLRLYRR